jgi:LPS-assembly protein
MSGYMIAFRKRFWPLACCALLPALTPAAEPACQATLPPLRLAAAPLPLPDNIDVNFGTVKSVLGGPTEACQSAEVKFADRSIKGDCLVYDPAQNSLRFTGHFRYLDSALRLEADNGTYDNSGAHATGASFQLLQRAGHGAAQAVSQTAKGEYELSNVSYTTCPADQTDWQLIARRITLNIERERGVGRGARIEFKGVPIFYVPWISFPLSDKRQSGFLYPTFGTSSRGGVTIATPYYLNLSPKRDLTLTPTLYSRRGLKLGSEFRALEKYGRGELQVDFMPSDSLPVDGLTGQHRSYQRLATEWQLPASWRARLNAENVSDTHYFEDFSQGPLASSTTFLARHAELGYRDDNWRARVELLQFQTLDQQLTGTDRPYALFPRVSVYGRSDLAHDWRTTVDIETSGFERATTVGGWRAVLRPALSWQHVRPGYYLRPSLTWDLTGYRLHNQAPGAQSSLGRSVPIFEIDSGLQLERALKTQRRLTLEPRVLYTYIPYRDQSQLPVFDSGLPDPNFVSLYRSNRYLGADRVGDANKLAVGFTSRLVDAATGVQYLSATLSQSFQFVTPRVTLPGESISSRSRSNLIANMELRAYRNFSVRADLAWNPGLSAADRSQLSLQYRRAGNQVLNLSYRYDRGSVEQADVSGAWPLGKRWDGYARAVYSLRDTKTIDNFVGLRFHGSCWGLRAVVRRALSSRTGERDTGWYLQFELNGLSSVGTGADTFLQESIQGYSASTPLP